MEYCFWNFDFVEKIILDILKNFFKINIMSLKKYFIIGLIILAEIAFILYFILGPQTQRISRKVPPQVQKAITFINENLLVGTGITAQLDSDPILESGVYKFLLDVGGQKIWTFVTKDGRYLFPQGIDVEKGLPFPLAQKVEERNQPQNLSLSTEGEPILGDPSAPITMYEFSDFECPFCGKYAIEIFPKIKKEYVDSGKLKIVFKNFPLEQIHKNAKLAAEASECAFEQGKFWEYKDLLFKNQEKLGRDDLINYAKNLNLNIKQFTQCLDSKKYETEVNSDLQEGIQAGVSGTPTFFIEGEKISGALPFEEFKKVIDSKLPK